MGKCIAATEAANCIEYEAVILYTAVKPEAQHDDEAD